MKKQSYKEKISQDIMDALSQEPYSPFFRVFLREFLDYLPQNHFERLNRSDFLEQISTLWSHFFINSSRDYRIELYQTPLKDKKVNRLFLTITGPARTYLVESVGILLKKWELKAEVFIHPIFYVQRSAQGEITSIEKTNPEDENDSLDWGLESLLYIQMRGQLSAIEMEEFRRELYDLMSFISWIDKDKDFSFKTILEYADRFHYAKGLWEADDINEAKSFLNWLDESKFVFLGSRYFALKTPSKTINFINLQQKEESLKGIFKNEIVRNGEELTLFSSKVQGLIGEASEREKIPPLVRVSKSNRRSEIDRSSRIESVEILDYDKSGQLKGVYQYVGIFKKWLFNLSSLDIPLIRQKAQRVFNRFGLEPTWHDGKALMAILESIPRDEMFYLSEDKLYEICSIVFRLQEQGGVSLFIRADSFGYYQTVMVFLSREKFSPQLKDAFSDILSKQLEGKVASEVVQLGDLPFARIIYVVEFEKPNFFTADVDYISELLKKASLTWFDKLENYLEKETKEQDIIGLVKKYKKIFPVSYQERFDAEEAYDDINCIKSLSSENPIGINMYFQTKKIDLAQQKPSELHSHITSIQGALKVKIYHYGSSLMLSDLLPVLSNLGVKVLSETTHNLKIGENTIYIHEFDVSLKPDIHWLSHLDLFNQAFIDVWAGNVENDGFNQLVLYVGLTSRQVNTIRAYVKYLLQAQLPYSQTYIENALSLYPNIVFYLNEYFERKFCLSEGKSKRQLDKILSDIYESLNVVSLLDHDKIFRRILNVMESTIRTNYYQKIEDENGNNVSKPYLSFKLDSQQVFDLPSPRPLYEIFVYSSRVEGIHLRGGKVARGGIRWSDRFHDFRTEILGLMKAQMVKNTVIIPVGSKGGFIVKRQHSLLDRNEVLKEAIFCYQTLMRGMLDITDNLVSGKIVPPKDVIRLDGDDPYLVVAADKGTASFSDIANAISQDYNFWMDDAFASGGSAGYDHKKMAITSRGAWESVKRHFREMEIDIQKESFTVAGVGDMSGDVFGNGMLRSEQICLLFAFDHRHIFIDPNPDSKISFQERKRIFEMPRSSWVDYNKDLLSKGGGIYSRAEKIIHLSPEAQKQLNLKSRDNTPDDVIRAILCSQVDLLWFGGVGTFVKASTESNSDVGDVTNTAIRINGKMINAKVVGEGANLGMTQKARIEYALEGGRVNTDAIDNSAGVDCSDHEVNIKILYSSLKKQIDREERNQMLTEMTDDVAHLVLRNNYDQTRVLTLMQSVGEDNITVYQNIIKNLEVHAGLNRVLEYLPDDETYERRKLKGQGLTRPELAVVLAYSKMELSVKLRDSEIIDDPNNYHFLISYFPELLREKYSKEILKHPLHREILSTLMANNIINRVGPTFVYELCKVSGCSEDQVVNAFCKVTQLLNMEAIWDEIDNLDSLMVVDLQNMAYRRISQSLKIAVLRVLGATHDLSKDMIREVLPQLAELIEGKDKQDIAREIYSLQERGLSFSTIEKIVVLPYLSSVTDLAAIQMESHMPLDIVSLYFKVRSHFNLDLLQSKTLALVTKDEWQRTAQLGLLDDISQLIIALTQNIIQSGGVQNINEWFRSHDNFQQQAQELLIQLKSSADSDIGMITFAVRQLQRMPQAKGYLCSI